MDVTAVGLGKTIVSATVAGETAECEVMVFPDESVFIAGYEYNEEGDYTTRVWRNAEVVFEKNNGTRYVCTVSADGNVYAAPYSRYSGGRIVWENDTEIFKLDDYDSSVYINTLVVSENGNLYLGGERTYDSGESDAVIWKNESYIFEANYDSEIYSVFVSNGSVYAGGWMGDYPGLWRDGMKINIEPVKYAIIRSVYVSDKIYAVGHDGNNAVLWEDGDIKTVFDGPSEAYSVYKYEDDVYIGGAMNNYPAVWKNGELIFTGKEYGLIRTIDIFEGDVYAVGDEGKMSKAWKNGEVFFENEENLLKYIRKIGK